MALDRASSSSIPSPARVAAMNHSRLGGVDRHYAVLFRRRPLSGRKPGEPVEVRIVVAARSRKVAEEVAFTKLIIEHHYPRMFWYVVGIKSVTNHQPEGA